MEVQSIEDRYGKLLTEPDVTDVIEVDFGDKREGDSLDFVLHGTSIAHMIDDRDAVNLEATRCGVAMAISESKLKRPLRHGVLASWSFLPSDYMYLGTGRYTQLLLAQDYLRLRVGKTVCRTP